MQHCLQYLLLYGFLFGSLALAYASYTAGRINIHTFARATAALTAGRPVFGFVGWLYINQARLPRAAI